jgi:hypothetical protein
MADVFISYQRKQAALVNTLKTRFEAAGKDLWVDLDDIPKAADWLQQIEGAISFVCILTPDYLASEICTKELVHARRHHKQIIPVVRELDPGTVARILEGLPWAAEATENWAVLRSLNWIFLRETDDFEKAFQELLTATETDLSFETLRARLTVRAQEWASRDRNASYVLRGADLEEAEHWLAQSSTKGCVRNHNTADLIIEGLVSPVFTGLRRSVAIEEFPLKYSRTIEVELSCCSHKVFLSTNKWFVF